MSKIQLFSVFGDPIIHSKSPVLWNSAFCALNINAHYFRIKCKDGKTVSSLIREMGLVLANITAPLKELVIPYMDELDEAAQKIGAINTVINSNGHLIGSNTDWIGVAETLKHNFADPAGKKVIVIGAGGAAKAAVFGLLEYKAADIVIVNRTETKAEELAKKFNVRSVSVKDIYSELINTDIIVSCVPKIEEILDVNQISNEIKILCADYKEECSARFIKGTDWLLYQAVASFKMIFNDDPTSAMKKALNDFLEHKKKKISLIGFMGAGKTTISSELSYLLNYQFIDTDEKIILREKRSISEIFQNSGEEYFRNIETEVLADVLSCDTNKIISTGGGIILKAQNCSLLKEHTVRVWLWTSLDDIMQRITPTTRPLLNEQRFYERIPFYASNCDICVVSSGEIKELSRSILDEINKTIES